MTDAGDNGTVILAVLDVLVCVVLRHDKNEVMLSKSA